MKNFKLIALIIIVFIVITVVPIPSQPYKDGGTRAYTSLTYKIVKWNRLQSDNTYYNRTAIYLIPNNFKSIDELWLTKVKASILNSYYNEKKAISKSLGLDMSCGTISYTQDSHGGFHNDGLNYTTIYFEDDSKLLAEIKNSNLWSAMPLSENLNTFIYDSYLTSENGDTLFPTIENGYYFFKDKNSKNSNDDTEFLNRNYFNFTLAIYDTDTKTIYFAKLDT